MSHPLSIARNVLMASAAALLFTVPVAAQEPPTPPVMQQQQFPPEVQEMIIELEETQEKLGELQDRALAGSESLQAEQVRIQGVVEAALRVVEPEYESLVTRFGELQQEAAAAQQAEDMAAFQAVMTEAERLQMRLQMAQAQAFERDEVDSAVTEYREQLLEEMERLDPEAPRMMERIEELAERLEEILG
ncbi:hypothetical protein BH23GEM11_BH23GEM11_02940 [soil metagenome]